MSRTDREKWDRKYREGAYAGRLHPSPLLREWVDRIPRGRALDIACGAGRNAVYLAANGFAVEAIDISAAGLERAASRAAAEGLDIDWIEHDLDEPRDWDGPYALVAMIRYVNLPLTGELAERLAPGGHLVCELHLRTTDEDVAGPSSPAFRVPPGALAAAAGGLSIRHLFEGRSTDPDGRPVALAQLVARRDA